MKPSSSRQYFIEFTVVAILFVISYALVDKPIALWLHQHSQANISAIASFISSYFKGGTFYLPVVVIAGCCWLLKKQNTQLFYNSILLIFIFLVNAILGTVLKVVFSRARPYELYNNHVYGFHFLQIHANFWSFPSGHAFVASTFFSFIALIKPTLRWLCLLGILLMCAARMIVGAHYLGDVLFGSFLGYWVTKILLARYQQQLPWKLNGLLHTNNMVETSS